MDLRLLLVGLLSFFYLIYRALDKNAYLIEYLSQDLLLADPQKPGNEIIGALMSLGSKRSGPLVAMALEYPILSRLLGFTNSYTPSVADYFSRVMNYQLPETILAMFWAESGITVAPVASVYRDNALCGPGTSGGNNASGICCRSCSTAQLGGNCAFPPNCGGTDAKTGAPQPPCCACPQNDNADWAVNATPCPPTLFNTITMTLRGNTQTVRRSAPPNTTGGGGKGQSTWQWVEQNVFPVASMAMMAYAIL